MVCMSTPYPAYRAGWPDWLVRPLETLMLPQTAGRAQVATRARSRAGAHVGEVARALEAPSDQARNKDAF